MELAALSAFYHLPPSTFRQMTLDELDAYCRFANDVSKAGARAR